MSDKEIRNAVVKFDREDLLYGNYEIDIDTPVEVFITIKQMSKFIKQQEEIQWYEKENKHNQEIIIKQDQEIERLNNIINELKEWFKGYHKSYASCKWYEEDYIEFIEHLENELKGADKE